ncbi:Activating signal cointegrator 1-like protein [Drosera capensis]
MDSSPGQWLERALNDLCRSVESGLALDADMISGLVSYCELAPPQDAKEYLDNIVGEETGRSVIEEYLRKRGYSQPSGNVDVPSSSLHAYVKPRSDEVSIRAVKKPQKANKDASSSGSSGNPNNQFPAQTRNTPTGNQGSSRKKKSGKVVSLAEAAKGSIVFQQGKPCSCQARRHRLVSNCLSCGKIVCEQEGEGPCSFCGALVLKEGSTHAGLEQSVAAPLTDAEAAAEAYAKRLVDYDRNSAARTTVIDDQSDYYDEGNSWLSKEEKELLKKKQEELVQAEAEKRKKVVVSFDLVGRKVMFNEDEIPDLEPENSILRPLDPREANRIKPNPTAKIQPIFIDPGPRERPDKGKQHLGKGLGNGLCLEISGRVQHDRIQLKTFVQDNQLDSSLEDELRQEVPADRYSLMEADAPCSAY